MPHTTLACRLTPTIPSAIATIAIDGPSAVEVVLAVAELKVNRLCVGRVHFGTLELSNVSHDASRADSASEQIVVCRTQDDQVEIHCHGGIAVCSAILSELARQGCQVIDSADWPTSQSCPIAAAAEADLIHATTDKVAAVLVDQLGGALKNCIHRIGDLVRKQDRSSALSALEKLWDWRHLGMHLTSPWKVVFAGPPNVGKSSLMNAIVGQSKSIVHEQPGTTRDWIEAEIAVKGWPVSLTDTAGIRRAVDSVEDEGVQRSKDRVQQADLVVLVVDPQFGWTQTHTDMVQLNPPRMLVAWNKSDLLSTPPSNIIPELKVVATSAVTQGGVDQLLSEVVRFLVPIEPTVGEAVPFRVAHVRHIGAAIKYLQERDLEAARNELDRLTTSWTAAQESP